MMNEHNPDGVDSFVAIDYINHNPLVEDGREGNRALWKASVPTAATSAVNWLRPGKFFTIS